jgi:predicted DNA-binding transcriptional regulator AlpA
VPVPAWRNVLVAKRAKVWSSTHDSALLTVPGVAKLLKIPYTVALRLARIGEIPGKVNLGSRRNLFRRVEVERWITKAQ